MRGDRRWLLAIPTLLTLTFGCGESGNPGEVPESKDAASTRAFIENPGGVKERPSAKKKAGQLPPQPPR